LRAKKFVSRYGLYFGFVLKRVVDLKICFLTVLLKILRIYQIKFLDDFWDLLNILLLWSSNFYKLYHFSEEKSFKGLNKKCKGVNWEIWKTTIAKFLLKKLFK
jgi:hypothetical protein